MTPPLPGRAGRPVVAVDVDGVLNPTDAHRAAARGYRPHRYTGPTPTGEDHVTGTVWLHPAHGPWLSEILAAGADLVWCTSWRHLAADWIAPRLDLPALPVIDTDISGVRFGHQVKLGALYTATGSRPVAALDDEFGGPRRRPGRRPHRRRHPHPARARPRPPRPATPPRRPRPGLARRPPAVAATHPAPPTHGRVPRRRGYPTVPYRIGAPMHPLFEPADGEAGTRLNVGDPTVGKTRLLSDQCRTCIFRPGNPMDLAPGALADLVARTRAAQSYVVCHETLPGFGVPHTEPAVCRGFHDHYDTLTLRLIRHLWGFVEIDPPVDDDGPTDAA